MFLALVVVIDVCHRGLSAHHALQTMRRVCMPAVVVVVVVVVVGGMVRLC